jgi:hypothetical protein
MISQRVLSILLAGLACLTGNNATGDVTLDRLINTGVEISAKETVLLPAPTLAAGLAAKEQRRAMEALIKGRYTWAEFTRRSAVAPFLLKISGGEAGKQGIGRQVDLWFVLYGDMQKLEEDTFVRDQLAALGTGGDNPAGQAHVLTAAELADRHIELSRGQEDTRIIAAQMSLLDRVMISVTTQNVKARSADTLLVTSVLDSRFDGDKTCPNQWQAIIRDAQGASRLDQPQPYRGLGSYVQVTQLGEPADALLVEYHVAFAEPEGWFHGANLLRSKLPIVVQDAVRTLRRRLDTK